MSNRCIVTRVVSGQDDWTQLAAAWNELVHQTSGATAFQSHQFLTHWWRHLATDKSLFAILAERDDEILGIAPFQITRRKFAGLTLRSLEFMGMPDELDRPLLLVPDDDLETIRALLDTTLEHASRWDMIRLDELAVGSWQLDALKAWADENRLSARSSPLHPVPYLIKHGDWDWYVEQRSHRFARRLREAERKITKDHEVSYRWSHGGADLDELLADFHAIEYNSWKAYEGLDVGVESEYRSFYRELLSQDTDSLRGHVLIQYLDSKPSAATIAFSADGVYYSLQIAHDEAFNKYSPGTLLETEEMRWFFSQDKLHRYEFLGGYGGNKKRWTKQVVDTVSVSMRREGDVRGFAASILDRRGFFSRASS